MNISGFRTIGLSLVTLLGAAHLSTAEATPPAPDCHDEAAGFARGFCAGAGHDDWSSVTYTCEGGQAQIISVTCSDGPQEPQESIS